MVETIKSAKDLAKYYMSKGIPVYIEGDPGVGKSEAWAQIAAEEKIGFKDIRLAQMDPVDLRGLPIITGKNTTWARPDFWPVEEVDGKEGIILFDELGDCGKAMQSAAYQIILNGRAGPHVIPKGWYRCAAGNSQKSRAGAQAMSTALANRFAHIEVAADPACFHDYGAKMNFHHYVLGYIKWRPAHLFSMEGATSKAFASPRSWERVSKVCDAPQELIFKLVAGLVGEGIAGEFNAFLKTLDLPELSDILADPKRCHIPDKPAVRYALASMLARYMKRDNIDKIYTYTKREAFGADFCICTMLDATKRDPLLTETAAYTKFANDHQHLQL